MQNVDQFIHFARWSSFYWGIAVFILLGIFLFCWLKEPRRLLNGTLFIIFFLGLLAEFALLIFSTGNFKFIFVMGVIFAILVVILSLILVTAWIFLLWNAFVVWKRESHTLSNMLTLILAIILIAIWIINFSLADRSQFLPNWLNIFLSELPLIGVYLSVCALNFLVSDLLYQFVPRHYKDDYLIVLGAGLINGDQVSKLLGNRIDRAITYANKQEKKGRPIPKIIFSGGKGPDEKISEAQAMSDYAIVQGFDVNLIIKEDQSRNTYQNMTFSKRIIDQALPNARVKFFSNNYHIFRSGLYAKKAELSANGVGAKTRFYFLPNALIREFIAVFLMNRKRHLVFLTLIFILIVVLTFFSVFKGLPKI